MIKNLLSLSTKAFGKNFNLNILKYISNVTRMLAYRSHEIQFNYEWNTKPIPEWFDHYCDHYYLFRYTKNPLWLERGIFNLLTVKSDAEVLELCCGDGFNSYHFYSLRAKNIISVDYDKTAIAHAKRYNTANNIIYLFSDIRFNIPDGSYNNVIWDAGIAHFSLEDINKILSEIKIRLKPNGILSGYTIVENIKWGKSHPMHKYEFKSKDDLKHLYEPYFKNIKVFETVYPSRTNLYFWATDGILPFDKNWEFIK